MRKLLEHVSNLQNNNNNNNFGLMHVFSPCSMCSHWGSHQVSKVFPIAPWIYSIWFAQHLALMYINWKGAFQVFHPTFTFLSMSSLFIISLFSISELVELHNFLRFELPKLSQFLAPSKLLELHSFLPLELPKLSWFLAFKASWAFIVSLPLKLMKLSEFFCLHSFMNVHNFLPC